MVGNISIGEFMNYEYLFLISVLCNGLLLSWNLALLDSRLFWRRKWEKEVDKNE